MDPLSVVASITGILNVAAKVTGVLSDSIQKERDAPTSFRNIIAEVSALSVCLAQLSPFLRGTEQAPKSRQAAISIEQVVVVNTSCVLTLSELEKILDTCKLNEPMSSITRIRWARNEPRILGILDRIRASKSSLNLILTILSCTSLEEAHESMSNLATTVQTIVENSKEMTQKLADIEHNLVAPSRYATSKISCLPDLSDEALTITPLDQGLQHGRSSTQAHILNANSDLDKELCNSRVYLRTAHRHSISSLPSASGSTSGWSFLSGVSLAQISNMSVISLPLCPYEIWNPHHYESSYQLDSLERSKMITNANTDPFARNIEDLVERHPSVYKRDQLQDMIQRTTGISEELEPDGKASTKRTSILLLGAGEAGKSTLLRQMRIIYSNGFLPSERRYMRQVIFSNVITAFRLIETERRELGLHYRKPTSYGHEQTMICTGITNTTKTLPPGCVPAIWSLWADKGFQDVVKWGHLFALHDNFLYNLRNLVRLSAEDSVPSDGDVLHSCLRTGVITETFFELKQCNYRVVDVGGMRRCRKDWVHTSEDVDHIVFVVPLSGYDQCLIEDRTATQMQEALHLFRSSLSLTWFKESRIFLLFTKLDLFKEKIKRKPLGVLFPEYTGADGDASTALNFITNKFLSVNPNPNRKIDVQYVDTTDTEQVRIFLEDLERMVLEDKRHTERHPFDTSRRENNHQLRTLLLLSEQMYTEFSPGQLHRIYGDFAQETSSSDISDPHENLQVV